MITVKIAEIKLSKVSNKTVKLTFDADESICIDRAEKLNGDLTTNETNFPQINKWCPFI